MTEATLKSHGDNARLMVELRALLEAGATVYVEYSTEKKRTGQQNKSLHVFCNELAEVLNSHGIGLKLYAKAKAIDVPFDQALVKDAIVRPLLNALNGQESTADANTADYNRMHEILSARLPEMLSEYGAIVVPAWPTRFHEG